MFLNWHLRVSMQSQKALKSIFNDFFVLQGDGQIPESLFRLTALMIQHGIIELESIYKMLGPSDEVLQVTTNSAPHLLFL